MKNTFLLLVLIFTQKLLAQQPLSIPTKNHCSFTGTEWEEELYNFEKNEEVQKWITEILTSVEASQNFEVMNASVENVAAIFDSTTGKRYLLYSLDFKEKVKTAEMYAALVHEIGHHFNNHQLTSERRAFEELEADYFMGFVLAKSKIITSLKQAQKVIDVLPSSTPSVIATKERFEAIKNGWDNATKSLAVNSAGFDNDPKKEEFLQSEFQVFPCCSPLELPTSFFSKARTLGDIAKTLLGALDKNGYNDRCFKSFKGGFALITQIEQFNKSDYTIRNDGTRSVTMPISGLFEGVMDYFQKLVFPQKNYYRTFVFIVTAEGFQQTERNTKVTNGEAELWCRAFNKLPSLIAAKDTNRVTVTALVYEFEVPQSNQKPVLTCPSIDTKKHLVASKIWGSL